MIDYSNKVIWITGASSGIGEHLAYALSQRGAQLILSARRTEVLERVRQACNQPQNVHIVALDLSNESSVIHAFNEVIALHQRIDVLFNNGGISQRSEAILTPLEVDRKIFDVNFFHNILLGKRVAAHMAERGEGHIIVTSSLSGKWGFYLRSAYAASKHALHGFYESMRLELEPHNVRISIITPGFIATEISVHALQADGTSTGAMDQNQSKGITATECANQILRGLDKGKDDFGVGGKELLSLTLHRFFPKWFGRILRKQSAR